MEDKKWGTYYAAHNSPPKTSNIWCVRAKTRQKFLMLNPEYIWGY